MCMLCLVNNVELGTSNDSVKLLLQLKWPKPAPREQQAIEVNDQKFEEE